MTGERQYPPASVLAAWLVSLPLVFVASFGPACWFSSRFGGEKVVNLVYGPLLSTVDLFGSAFVRNPVVGYSHLFASKDWCWLRINAQWKWTHAPPRRPHFVFHYGSADPPHIRIDREELRQVRRKKADSRER